MKRTIITAIALGALFPFSAVAVDAHHQVAASGAASSAPLTEGEVRKVDKDAKKITIKHGPIQNLDMPPMTMVFQVKDPKLLDKVKAGDKINFAAESLGGQLTVTRIEPAK